MMSATAKQYLRAGGTALATGMFAIGLPTIAYAQDMAASALPAGTVNDIIVTARKRSESIQDIPVAITAFSAGDIQRKGMQNLEAVATATPQLVISRAPSGSGAQLSVRGVGSSFLSSGIEQSVAVIVDGAYYGQGRVINEGLFDLASIEVLMGPQALFFGKNATAGVISIKTAEPTGKTEIIARAGYELRSENLTGELIYSAPLNDTFGLRVAVRGGKMFGGYFRNRSGAGAYPTVDNSMGAFPMPADAPLTLHPIAASNGYGPEEKELMGRITLKWEPTDRITSTLKVAGAVNRTSGPSWNIVPICAGATQQLSGESCSRKFVSRLHDLPATIAASGVPFAGDGSLYNKYRSFSITNNTDFSLNDITISSTTNYYAYRNTFLGDGGFELGNADSVWFSERTKWRSFSNETRVLTSFDGPVNILIGAYYQKTKFQYVQYPIFASAENSSAPDGLRYVAVMKDSGTDGKTLSGYGQVIFKPLQSIEITGGARYIHETKKSFFVQPYANPLLTTFGIYVPDARVTRNQTFNNWSPEVTAAWKPVPGVNLYAAYRTGFKSGGFSNSSIYGAFSTVDDLVFEPEKASGFEVGAKFSLADRQLNLNLSGYSYLYKGLQVEFFNPLLISYFTSNAGSSRVKGVELGADFSPRAVPGLALSGNLNYNIGRYKDFLAACYAGQTAAEGCNLVINGGDGNPLNDVPGQQLAGKPLQNAPRWTARLGIVYRTPLTSAADIELSADGRYSSAYFASAFAVPTARASAYMTLDAGARLILDDGRWELGVVGKNLTNRFILTGTVDVTGTPKVPATLADQGGLIAMPRTVMLRVAWRH